jgi:hypothetical protein
MWVVNRVEDHYAACAAYTNGQSGVAALSARLNSLVKKFWSSRKLEEVAEGLKPFLSI